METAMLVALVGLATLALDLGRLEPAQNARPSTALRSTHGQVGRAVERRNAAYEGSAQRQPQSPPPQPPQDPRQPAKSDIAVPKGEEAVTVKGCVHGSHFKPSRESLNDVPTVLLKASEYVLDGKRELLQRLRKDHDGHYEEVTGLAKIPPTFQRADTHVRSKDYGKTRVTIGTREETKALLPTPELPVRILVDSFRHISDHCSVN